MTPKYGDYPWNLLRKLVFGVGSASIHVSIFFGDDPYSDVTDLKDRFSHFSLTNSAFQIDEDTDDELDNDLQLTDEDMRTDFVETDSYKRSNDFEDSPLYNFISTLMTFILEILLA